MANSNVHIRPFEDDDWPAVWDILRPIFREGTTYMLDRDIAEADARAFWTAEANQVFVAELGVHKRRESGDETKGGNTGNELCGSYFLRPNFAGPGSHVCNCGYVTSDSHRGKGIATAMCLHSQEQAIEAGFRSMQYNCVISTNEGAVRLWKRHGFEVVGRLPGAFNHPDHGFVDALVMSKALR